MGFLGVALGMVAAGFWMIAWGSVVGNPASVFFGVLAWIIAFFSFLIIAGVKLGGFGTVGDYFRDRKQKRAEEKASGTFTTTEDTTTQPFAAEAATQLAPEQSEALSRHTEDVLEKMEKMQDSLDELSKKVSKNESPAEPINNINTDLTALTSLLNEIKASVNALPAGLRGLLESFNISLEKLSREIKTSNKNVPDIINLINMLQSGLDQMDRSVRNIQGNTATLPRVQREVNAQFARLEKGFKKIIDAFNEKIISLKKDIRSIIKEELEQKERLSKSIELFNTFSMSIQNTASKLNTLIQYFVQVQAQNLPWQEKMVIDRAKKELDTLLEAMLKEEGEMLKRISEFEEKLKFSVEKLQSVSARLRAAPKAAFVRTISHTAQLASARQRAFSESVQAYKRALTNIGASLVHVSEDLLGKKVDAKEIGVLTGRIITELQHSLDLIGKLNSELVPALNAQMKSFGSESERWTTNLVEMEKDLIINKPVAIKKVEPVVAKPAPEMTSREYVLLLRRVEATLDKLDHIKKMPNFMKDVEAIRQTKNAFETIMRFYKMFEKSLQARKRASINRCKDYEKKIVPYLHHFNSMLVKLSAAPYNKGGSEHEDLVYYVRKRYRSTKNPYYTTSELSLPR